ncbi:MAG: glycosyltransferase [Alphaproteobacteria bacterium]|nr:glycosyltransferase [Alphaproteobacteria bacterium]
MMVPKRTKVSVLVDLPRGAAAGGHVKYWERMSQACATHDYGIALTVYFSGNSPDIVLSEHVRYRFLPPVFSTERLGFLPYVPAHTDLAPYHPRLARELTEADVIHTTDAYFAFAQTSERVALRRGIPLVTSFHTDTPAYAELFTRETLRKVFGSHWGPRLDSAFGVAKKQRCSKQKRLERHLRVCRAALTLRPEDKALVQRLGVPKGAALMRMGVDKTLFAPRPAARAEIERDYGIDPDAFLVLFVGRVDAGKNAPLLADACAMALGAGTKLHLIVVGEGPSAAPIQTQLQKNVTLTGQVSAERLATLYAAANVLAMASDIEIGGLVGVEALASGCPVFVSKVSGIAGLYGRPPAIKEVESTPRAWAAAFSEAARDLEQAALMRKAALDFRERSIADWSVVLQEDFLPVWQSVEGEKRCSAGVS